jgi:DNA-binding transcriptional MerR regulator
MKILSSGEINISAPTPPMRNVVNSTDKNIEEAQLGVHVSISQEAKDKNAAESKQAGSESTDKKNADEPLRFDGTKLNSSKTEKEPLSAEEKLELRIEEVKEKIKELQKEIQALRVDDSAKAQEKAEILTQQLQALLLELTSLMEQKLESK